MLKKNSYPKVFMAVALLMLAILPVRPAFAAPSFTVNSVLDEMDDNPGNGICHTANNTCTLRAAIMEANRVSGVGATIVLPDGTYTLTIPAAGANGDDKGDLDLTTPASGNPVITITGAGADTTIIDANQIDRVFYIDPSRTATISGVTIRNGYAPTRQGGGIFNAGILQLGSSTLSGNSANFGGGIYNNGTLTVSSSTLSQNNSDVNGGGISNSDALTVSNSTLSQNNSAFNGGGIYNNSFTFFMVNSTLSGNSANNNGGGIYNFFGNANVYNTSIVFNDADADIDPNGGSGGGVFNDDASGSTFNLRNTLMAGNYVSGAPVYRDCSGTLNSYGRNLFWDVTGCTVSTASGSWTTLNSLGWLGPLQNNGGPTMTVALLPGSNAIDGGDPVFGCTDYNGNTIATDQRGFARVVGAHCDIGAYEFSPVYNLFLPLILR